MQPAADGADRHAQDLGHRFVLLAVDVLEHQHRPVLGREALQGVLHAAFLLRLLQSVFRPAEFGSIQRLALAAVAPRTDGMDDALLPPQADGRIDSDAIQPGEKLGVALEAGQRLVSMQKGVLHDILRVFCVRYQPMDRVVKPILIATNQFAKGCRSPLQTVSDKSLIVRVHGSLL